MYRRKLGKSKVSNIHRFVSLKNPSLVLTESVLEFDCCYSLEYSSSVVSYESQPEGFEYIFENRIHRYTPDFKSRMIGGERQYIEVKPERIAKRQDFLERFLFIRTTAERSGIQLLLWTEEIIRRQPYCNNLKILHRYRTRGHLTSEQRKVIEIVRSSKGQKLSIWDYAVLSDKELPQFLPLAYDLLARNELTTDLDVTPLTKDSVVRICHDHHPAFH
ncbi:TnsA endonuclease N-terminal domain-containing protein [Endozoicomonadaceae bacterium StTr2]